MLAMCSLDALLRMDALWLEHLTGHGYLAALAESLQADDAPLRGLLVPQPHDLRPLYLYESKMVSYSDQKQQLRVRVENGQL